MGFYIKGNRWQEKVHHPARINTIFSFIISKTSRSTQVYEGNKKNTVRKRRQIREAFFPQSGISLLHPEVNQFNHTHITKSIQKEKKMVNEEYRKHEGNSFVS